MDSDEDSRSSNSSGSSSSSSPTMQQQRDDEKSLDAPPNDEATNSLSPARKEVADDEMVNSNKETQARQKSDEEELELSDIDNEESKKQPADISHEDLSDISDLESSNDVTPQEYPDLRHKLNKINKRRQNGSESNTVQKSDEEELDFEGDEDVKEDILSRKKQRENVDGASDSAGSVKEDGEHKSDKEEEAGDNEELEDGEVTDGDEKRPEESEPKAVCRFFTRGQCTWGMSCRFLHPGTTDKGNYTMFELVRPMPAHPPPMMMPAYDYRTERPPLHHLPPHATGGYAGSRVPPTTEPESAWERGLRTAKEMMRKANKRKELDIDFEEKKMNLSGPPDEIERDPYYHGSPTDITPPFERERRMPPTRGGGMGYSPPAAKYPRSGPPYYEEDQYGRMPRSYRELPAHRMPHYEDDDVSKRRIVRNATREVIVEKADDWNDPWMRKGDSGKDRKARGRERSYSSNSSYSSSSTSTRSRSSSDSSHSPSPSHRKGGASRFEGQRSKERPSQALPHRIDRPKSRSSSLKRRDSPGVRSRITATNKKAPSPISAPPKRKKTLNSPPPRDFNRRKKRNSSSGSSSGSESDSSYSSSTSSSNKAKKRREKIVSERKVSSKKADANKSTRTPPPATKDSDEKLNEKAAAAAKLKSSRREELLKQLRAVEDAIARKRSKIA